MSESNGQHTPKPRADAASQNTSRHKVFSAPRTNPVAGVEANPALAIQRATDSDYGPGKRPCSILVLTKNEEQNITECLKTLMFSDDIVVLDSYSTDRTCEIAASFPNVRVIQRKFDTWSRHSNWALENIRWKHDWVYYSDADERVPQNLRDEIVAKCNIDPQPSNAYRLKYKNMFMGRWLRYGGIYPVWIIRLFKPDLIRYEDRAVNAHPVVEGHLGSLDHDFIHYSFNKGLVPWFIKHNSYSDMESKEAVRVRQGSVWSKIQGLFSREPGVTRRSAKDLSFFPPLRAFIRFFYMYVIRMAVFDGRAGFHYAAMISMYEYWIEVKIREIEKNWNRKTEAQVRVLLSSNEGTSADEPANPSADGATLALVSVMIPTFNEASHIAETVRNARQLGPVFVLDSFSTDGTQELARKAGATVIEHKFENYSKQKNFGLDELPFTSPWLFILDADERLTPELVREVQRVASAPSAASGYYVNRVVIMMGREIRHGGAFPSWNLRFFKRGTCRYEDRSVHEHMVCDGPTEYLKHLMLHIRRESISEYLAKHIRYADMESDEWIKLATGVDKSARAGRLFRDLLKYRLLLRRDVWPRVPFKPFVRFFWMYFIKLGVLDGRPGWHLANLMACYEYMIQLLYQEKLHRIRHPEQSGLSKSDIAFAVRPAAGTSSVPPTAAQASAQRAAGV